MAALDGFTVIELARLFPVAYCTSLLADHGADVIAVEAPRFRERPVVGEVPMVRRNKRHIALDLGLPEGREALFALLRGADVLVEGFRPGVADRLGISHERVSRHNSGIIYCSLTGYGQHGRHAAKAGHDLNHMAMSGLLDLIRDSAGNPIAPNVPLAGLSGSLFAALGILLALLSRERAGAGQHLDVALSDSLVSMLAMPMAFALSGSALPGRPQGKPQVSFPCYRMYRTRDGRHISVGPLEGHLWKELCRKLGCPEYEEFQYDEARTEEIAAHLSALFESRNLDEWIAELNSPDDCVAPVNLIGEVAGEPHFRDRGVIDIPDVGVPQPAVLPRLSGTPGEIRLPPYRFGQHTREILQEHGYSDGQIAAMTASGAAWEPPAPANGTAEG